MGKALTRSRRDKRGGVSGAFELEGRTGSSLVIFELIPEAGRIVFLSVHISFTFTFYLFLRPWGYCFFILIPFFFA